MNGFPKAFGETHPNLVRTTGFGQVAHPFDAVVVALFKDLEEPDNQARRGKHQHLKINIYWRSCPDLSMSRTRQFSGGGECAFLAALDARNPRNP